MTLLQLWQDGPRNAHIKKMAKAAKKELKLGKPSGPPIYTAQNDAVVSGLNKREKEALDINYGILNVTRLKLGANGQSLANNLSFTVSIQES